MMRENYPKSAILAITYRCNSRCQMCDIWKKELKRKEICEDLYKKLPPGLESIDITGGEPFLSPRLLSIVKVLTGKFPNAQILITSNGYLTQKIANLSPQLIRINPKLAFRISLDGWERNHDQIRGVKGAFEKAQKTIKILKMLEVRDLGIIYTLLGQNYTDLNKILNYCKKEKLHFSLNLIHESPIYFGQGHKFLNPNYKQTREAIKKVMTFFAPVLSPKDLAKIWFYKNLIGYAKNQKRPIVCGAGENFFYIDPYGNFYPCHLKNWKIGNLLNQSFEEIWQGKKRKEYLKLAARCNDCFMICTTKDRIKKEKWRILKEIVFSFGQTIAKRTDKDK